MSFYFVLYLRPSKHRVFHTEEGFDITQAFDCKNPIFIPVSTQLHSTKLLPLLDIFFSNFANICLDIYPISEKYDA